MKKILIGVVVLAVLIGGGSQLIPSEWKVGRSVVIQAKPQAIYPLVADWRNWEKWSALSMPGMTFTYSGPKSGLGAICVAKTKDMEITNEIVKADPATGITYECRIPGWNKADCTIAFSPAEGGTRVEYTYVGKHDRNPFHRIMGLLMTSNFGKGLEAGLVKLKEVAEAKKK